MIGLVFDLPYPLSTYLYTITHTIKIDKVIIMMVMVHVSCCPPLGSGEPDGGVRCEVDPSVFEPPADYATLGPGRSEPMRDDDDNLLQFAIQQSLLDAGTESDQVPP